MSREITLLLAGDALIARAWSHVDDADFLGLIDTIRDADVAIANLETVIHEFKGHAQANSGGIHMASPPPIAAELKWAGFDMLSHANNHAFDYGSLGVLETLDHAERAGLIVAGSGPDLQRARAPRYLQCASVRVALVAMAVDYVGYGKASCSLPDLHGRPGVNPLTLVSARSMTLRPLGAAKRAWDYCRRALRAPAWRPPEFQIAVSWDRKLDAADESSNLEIIAEGASHADIAVVSIHAHRQGDWLGQFAHRAIERGAGVVFIHGPHHVRGVEFHRGRPIFHSMGDFVFETEHVALLPAETYEQVGLPADASPMEALNARRGPAASLRADRATFEGFVTLLSIAEGRLDRIQLVPIDLQFDGASKDRGRPKLASAALGERIIATVASRSKKFGTRIDYDRTANRGEVVLDS